MAETKAPEATEFPPFNFPTLYADGVGSIANTPQVVKFYLIRNELSFLGHGKSKIQQIAQVVMPIDSFAQMFTFFESATTMLLQQGVLSEETLRQLRQEQAGKKGLLS